LTPGGWRRQYVAWYYLPTKTGQNIGGAGMKPEINKKRTHTTIEFYPETIVWKYLPWLNATTALRA
jgi:hypothetical protein